MSEEQAIISSSATGELPQQRRYGAWAIIGIGIAIVLISLLAMPILVELMVQAIDAVFNKGNTSDGLRTALSIISTGLSGMLLIYLIIRMSGNSFFSYLGLRRLNWKIVFLALAAFIIAIVCISGFSMVYEYFAGASSNSSNSDFMDNTYSGVNWWLLWMAVVVCAPVFEETLFRGFLFVGLQRSRLRVVGTIILTSLVWALLHLQYNLFGMVTIVLLGIVLGVTRYKTGSLWSAILVHAMWNGMAQIFTALG